MNKLDVVQTIYRDFAAGDAAAILAVFAEDVEFRLTENHPYRGVEVLSMRNKSNRLEELFMRLVEGRDATAMPARAAAAE